MNPLKNIRLFDSRIKSIAKTAPKAPVKGRGNARHKCDLNYLFDHLNEMAPSHCAEVVSREPINSYGKLGMKVRNYVSPELFAALEANRSDLQALNDAAESLVAAKMTYMVSRK